MSSPNHLAGQRSPYLLQHLHNPGDWYPWGEEAFARARAENKPIFLSVGYSTCHWCHVMERECFENETVAALLNRDFVSVKVDREERPDVDRIHMSFLQASTGGGGWPMSVWLTPELQPFLAGTYFPPEDTPWRPGFIPLLRRIAAVWAASPDRVREQAGEVVAALAASAAGGTAAGGDFAVWRDQAVRELERLHDPENGGFGRAPKFPQPGFLSFLLGYQVQGGEAALRESARRMALTTLRRIVASSLRDHIGGGFHRYAVDERWRLPHFEKMLYDQAQLAGVCLDAWLVTREPPLRRAAEECLLYLETRMRAAGGAFHAAEDADSPLATPAGPRQEGAFYVWTTAELRAALGERAAAVFAHAYGIEAEGNLGSAPAGEFAGKNLPTCARPQEETATAFGRAPAETEALLAGALRRLREVRAQRPPVDRDDKIVCAWNGLVLSALAKAAQHLGSSRWAETATRLAEFLRTHLHDAERGRLHRTWCAGAPGPDGFAEDYSLLIRGLLDLFDCSQESRWLEWALALQATQDELFRDRTGGGYFASGAEDRNVLVRLKDDHDGAEPSASSVAVENKVRLAGLLHRPEFLRAAHADVAAFAGTLAERPLALPQMLAALGGLGGASRQLIVVGCPGEPATEALLGEVRSRHLPHLSLLVLHEANRGFFERQNEFFATLPRPVAGRPLAFLCQDFTCRRPVGTPAELAVLLDPSGPR